MIILLTLILSLIRSASYLEDCMSQKNPICLSENSNYTIEVEICSKMNSILRYQDIEIFFTNNLVFQINLEDNNKFILNDVWYTIISINAIIYFPNDIKITVSKINSFLNKSNIEIYKFGNGCEKKIF